MSWCGKMSLVQNVWVSECLDLYAVAQCLGGIMSGWQNVLVSKCLGARISCSHNVWVWKRGVSKCPGVKDTMSRFFVEVLDPLDNLRIRAGGFYRDIYSIKDVSKGVNHVA